ncbi:MAG TPA: hypothetical protein VIH45_08545 [Desulfuromonadaceae bacterium]
MVITFLHLIAFVLFVFWMAVMYSIINHSNEQRHRNQKEDRHHWPYHHA